jgi:hypothetical protein
MNRTDIEPILPSTRMLSIQYMTDGEFRHLCRQLRRKTLGIPQCMRTPNDPHPATMVLPPRAEPHNCMRCGVKTNWIVWEQIEVESRKHVSNFGTCLRCDPDYGAESGYCDYPDAGWGHEMTIDESEAAYKRALAWFNTPKTGGGNK